MSRNKRHPYKGWSKGEIKRGRYSGWAGIVATVQQELIVLCSQASATENHKLTASPDMPTFLVYHVTSDTRPSPFSACNIEKVHGSGLFMRLLHA